MSSLFAILSLVSLALLVWGVVAPRSLGNILRFKRLRRGRAALGFGLLTFGLLIAVGATAAPTNRQPAKVTVKPTAQKQATNIQGDSTETKQVTETKPLPYTTTTKDDTGLPKGQTKVVQAGQDGVTTYTYKITYTNGKETSRKLVSQEVTTPAVDQIVHNGTYVAPAPKPAPAAPSCSDGYINVDGNCVHSPSSDPSGATAQCVDGTYSYSQHRSGTCSHHGGVARWL